MTPETKSWTKNPESISFFEQDNFVKGELLATCYSITTILVSHSTPRRCLSMVASSTVVREALQATTPISTTKESANGETSSTKICLTADWSSCGKT